jgi:hypothetical protein
LWNAFASAIVRPHIILYRIREKYMPSTNRLHNGIYFLAENQIPCGVEVWYGTDSELTGAPVLGRRLILSHPTGLGSETIHFQHARPTFNFSSVLAIRTTMRTSRSYALSRSQRDLRRLDDPVGVITMPMIIHKLPAAPSADTVARAARYSCLAELPRTAPCHILPAIDAPLGLFPEHGVELLLSRSMYQELT